MSKQNYAYLYDRVMLKLAGKQRYATQGMCRGGKHVPQPLEDEPAVDRLRSAMGLNPLRDYMAQLEKFAGACPPGPEGPVPGAR